jgi:excisionase family DNA binding protein
MQQQIILNGITSEDLLGAIRGIVQDEISTIHKPQPQKPFLTLEEAVSFIGLSKSNIYRLTSTRQIPHIKCGGKLLFSREEITVWLEASKQPIH